MEAAYIIGTVFTIVLFAGVIALRFAQAIAIEKKKEAEMEYWKKRVDKLTTEQKENIALDIVEYLYRRHK